MNWAQFGTAIVKGSLLVAVGAPDDPAPAIMQLDFEEIFSVPLMLTLNMHVRTAVNQIMRGLAGRSIENETANMIIKAALEIADEAKVPK